MAQVNNASGLSPQARSLQPAYEKARADLRAMDPEATAWRADVPYTRLDAERGRFVVSYFDRRCAVAYPGGVVTDADTGQEASIFTQILVLHYLVTANGAPLKGQWVTFRNLPAGLMYERAFRARSLDSLIKAFGNDEERFAQAAVSIGGEPARLGDRSFLFRALPRVPLMCVLWLGDEEVQPEIGILFDASAGSYLPTEDLAALGGTLSGRLLRAAVTKASTRETT